MRRTSIDGGESSNFATAPEGWTFGGIEANRADGRLLIGLERCTEKCQYKVAIVPASGGAPQILELPANFVAIRPHWTPDNRRIAVFSMDGGVGRMIDVWSIASHGTGKPLQLTDFKSPSSSYFSWSPDGKQLLVSRGMLKFDPILVRNVGN